MSAWGLRPVPDNVPEALRALTRWVCWRAKRKPNGKQDKIPLSPFTGVMCSTAEPQDWGTYDQAVRLWSLNEDRVSGIGLVLTGNADGLFAIDIDNAPAITDPRVQALLGVKGLYLEQSPSGRGYRAIGYGEVPEFTHHAVGVEVYTGATARFITMTGAVVQSDDLSTRVDQEALQPFLDAYQTEDEGEAGGSREYGPHPPVPQPDPALQARAREALPQRLRPRWDTGVVPEGYPSRSEADAAIYVALVAGGLSIEEAWAACVNNGWMLDRALKRKSMDRALKFLWEEVNGGAAFERDSPRGPAQPGDFALGSEGALTTRKDSDEGTTPVTGSTVPHRATRGKLVRASQLNRQPQVDWLVRRYIESRTLMMLFGEPGSGKSFVALDLAVAVARGVPWNGEPTKRGMVVYVAGEGHQGIARRLAAHALHHGYDLAELDLFVSRLGIPLTDAAAVGALLEEVRTLELLYDCKCVLLEIDTLRRNFGIGDENSTKDMGAFIAGCSVLQHALDCTVAVVHHSGHADKGRERGSSTLIGDFDIRYQVAKTPQGHYLRNVKMKDAETPPELTFGLTQVDLGYADDQGAAVTSAVPEWGVPRVLSDDATVSDDPLLTPVKRGRAEVKAQDKLQYGASRCLHILEDLMAHLGETPPPDCIEQGAELVVRVEHWVEQLVARRVCRTNDQRSVSTTVGRWRKQLLDQGLIGHSDDRVFYWVTPAGVTRLRSADDLIA